MRYDDNLARQEEYYYYRPRKKKRGKKSKKGQAAMLHKVKILRRMCCTVVITLAAVFMITKFVAVNETASEVESLTKQLEAAQAANSQKVFEVEQSIDLAALEKEAESRLGMQRPSKNQTIYVNVKSDDKTETTAQEAEALSSRLSKWFGEAWSKIIEYFSIK